MNIGISKFSAKGSEVAPPSKSLAHRLLIAAALKNGRTVVKKYRLFRRRDENLRLFGGFGREDNG